MPPEADDLLALLDRRDLSAVALRRRHEPALRGWLGEAQHRPLQQAVDRLDFAAAAALLRSAMATASSGASTAPAAAPTASAR